MNHSQKKKKTMKLEICDYFLNGKYENAYNDDTCTFLRACENDIC